MRRVAAWVIALAAVAFVAPAAMPERPASRACVDALALQADGKLVAAGWATNRRVFALARYVRTGRLDQSFGSGGRILTGFGSSTNSAVWDVEIQSDGKIVAAGSSNLVAKQQAVELARYRRNGKLDLRFGRGGKVLTRIGRYSGASAVAIQPNGKLVVAGWSSERLGYGHVAFVRYTRAGKPDATFGRNGKVVTSWPSGAYIPHGADGARVGGNALAIQPDAKIVVNYTQSSTVHGIARFNANGSLDTTFGRSGKVALKHSVEALAIEAGGKIVAAGSAPVETNWGGQQTTNNPGFALTRLLSDGSMDKSFGEAGTVLTDFTKNADTDKSAASGAFAIQADGKVVAAGATDALDHRGDHPNTTNDDVAVARYTPDGKPDASFGSRGKLITSFNASGNWDTGATDVAVQRDGRIVVAGPRSLGAGDVSHDFLLMRYTPTGHLDGSFGRKGKVTTSFPAR